MRDHELQAADDESVWTFAKAHGFTIVSKDNDFHQRSFLYGAPPKIVWLKSGNCSTDDIENHLRRHATDIQQFDRDSEAALLVLT